MQHHRQATLRPRVEAVERLQGVTRHERQPKALEARGEIQPHLQHGKRTAALLRPGLYTKLPTDDPELVTIEDLSYTGVRFRTRFSHNIEEDDVLTVDFILDNRQHSRIIKRVRVMYIIGRAVGGEFRDRQAYSTELTYYLNPS